GEESAEERRDPIRVVEEVQVVDDDEKRGRAPFGEFVDEGVGEARHLGRVSGVRAPGECLAREAVSLSSDAGYEIEEEDAGIGVRGLHLVPCDMATAPAREVSG